LEARQKLIHRARQRIGDVEDLAPGPALDRQYHGVRQVINMRDRKARLPVARHDQRSQAPHGKKAGQDL